MYFESKCTDSANIVGHKEAEPVKELTPSQVARARKVARNTSTKQTAGSYKSVLEKVARNHQVSGSVQEARKRKIDRQNRG